MTAPAGVSISPPLRRIKDCDEDGDAQEEDDEQMTAAVAATDSP